MSSITLPDYLAEKIPGQNFVHVAKGSSSTSYTASFKISTESQTELSHKELLPLVDHVNDYLKGVKNCVGVMPPHYKNHGDTIELFGAGNGQTHMVEINKQKGHHMIVIKSYGLQMAN